LVGEPGGGGEYVVQEGFGWTNGVILWALKEFGSLLVAPAECLRYATDQNAALARLKEKHELDIFVERQDAADTPSPPSTAAKGIGTKSAERWHVAMFNEPSSATSPLPIPVAIGLGLGATALVGLFLFFMWRTCVQSQNKGDKKYTPAKNASANDQPNASSKRSLRNK
jgi:hypothetical protein